MWWMTELGITSGGVSKTDLPLRVCVYPSYNIHDNEADPKDPEKKPKNVPAFLLCSYTWSMDAQRMGTLIDRHSPQHEDDLKTLMLDNLARLHETNDLPYEKLLKKITDLYDTHFTYDWYNDSGTTGAFAYFGPGHFRKMYPYVVRNNGGHIIIGEAASAYHAWVIGAIESAVRGVYQFAYQHSKKSKICDQIVQDYNKAEVPKPWGPIPKDFDGTEDVKPLVPGTGKITGEQEELINGDCEWIRQGVQVENWRLAQDKDLLDPIQVTEDQVKDFTVFGMPKQKAEQGKL